MDTLIPSVLASLLRNESPPIEALERIGEVDPVRAAADLLAAATLPELADTRSSWVPALLASARPGRGARRLVELARTHERVLGARLDPRPTPALALVLGNSEFLAQQLLRRPEWVEDLVGDPPPAPDLGSLESGAGWDEIRDNRRRGLLRAVARELLGCPLRESLRELSDLADGCLRAALVLAVEEMGIDSPPALLALGPLGGREVGITPDLDLLFVDADAASEGAEAKVRADQVACLVEHFMRELERSDESGTIYRADRGHRPEGIIAGPLSEAVEYFGSPRADSERQLLLRCRSIAGNLGVASEFMARAQSTLAEMGEELVVSGRLRCRRGIIEQETECDLRSGDGGIFELEAIVRAHQLRGKTLVLGEETAGLFVSLDDLSERGVVDAERASDLSDAYAWLLRAEHALQLLEHAPVREFPTDPEGQLVLARCMGYREPDATRARTRLGIDREIVREEVARQFDSLFHPRSPNRAAAAQMGLISASVDPIKTIS